MANYEYASDTLSSYQVFDDVHAELMGSYNNYHAHEADDLACKAAEVYLETLSDRYEYCGFNDDMVDLAIALEIDSEEDIDDSPCIPDIHPFMCGVFLGNRIAHSELGSNFDTLLQEALYMPSHTLRSFLHCPGNIARLQRSIIADARDGHERASVYVLLALHTADAFQNPQDRAKLGWGFGVVMQKMSLAIEANG